MDQVDKFKVDNAKISRLQNWHFDVNLSMSFFSDAFDWIFFPKREYNLEKKISAFKQYMVYKLMDEKLASPWNLEKSNMNKIDLWFSVTVYVSNQFCSYFVDVYNNLTNKKMGSV